MLALGTLLGVVVVFLIFAIIAVAPESWFVPSKREVYVQRHRTWRGL